MSKNPDSDLPSYDFSRGVRGKYDERVTQGTNVVLLDPDVTAKLKETVGELIARLPLSGVRMPEDLPALAKRLDVLPLTWDMGGCVALRPSGELVSWVWDEEDRISANCSSLTQHAAMFLGAAKFSELLPFVPGRPVNAKVCTACDGTGTVSGLPVEFACQIACRCGGSGWLPVDANGA
jgi:hypothetical protein